MPANNNTSNMNDFEHPYSMLLIMAEEERQAHVGDGGDGISNDNIDDDSIADDSISLNTQPPTPTGRSGHDDDEFNANDDDPQPRNVNAGDEDGDDDIPNNGDDVTEAAQTGTSNNITPETNNHGFPTPSDEESAFPASCNRDSPPSISLSRWWNVPESETTEDVTAAQTVTYNIRLAGREDEPQEQTASAGTNDNRTKSKEKKGEPQRRFLHRTGHEEERKRKKKTGKQPPHPDDSDEDFQVADNYDYDDDEKIEDEDRRTKSKRKKKTGKEVYEVIHISKKRRTRNNIPKYTPEQFFGVGANSSGEESVDSQYEAKMKAPATTRHTRSQVHEEIPLDDRKPAAKTPAELLNSINERHEESTESEIEESTESEITGVVYDDAAVDAEAHILENSDDNDDLRTVDTVEAQIVDDAAVDIEAQIESDDDEDTAKDLIHYYRDQRIHDAEYSWILEMPLDRLKEDCRPFLKRHGYSDNALKTREGHENYLFQQYLHEHTKNRRTIITRPISCNQVKDDCASRKFEVCANNLKDLYHCSMYPPWSSDLIANPRVQTFLMVHDEMIQRPDLQKGRTDSKDYVRKRPQTSFLVPDGTDYMELADILENAALKLRACKEISVRKLKARKTNLVVTSDHNQLCKQIYGKKFEPKNQDPAHKQRKQI